MSIIVYFINKFDGLPHAPRYEDHEFDVALNITQLLRKQGHSHVIMSNEPAGMVGKPGVAAVEDGKTPDGEDYEWSKAGRAGRMRRSDADKTPPDGRKL